MGDFKKRFGGHGGGFGGGSDRRGGGRGGFGGGGRDRGPVTMHEATCDQCGKSCEVPFRPTGEKPVYCSTCFEGKKETGDNRGTSRSYNAVKPSFGSDISKGSNDELAKQLGILNTKMDRLIGALETMANIKPLAAEAVKSVKKVSKK
jgi:CxxC-x17-CxxC domain-containing protein